MGPNYTQKDLHSKGNHKKSRKATHRMGENICKQNDHQEIHLQNIQTAHAAQHPIKSQTPQRKMGRRLK